MNVDEAIINESCNTKLVIVGALFLNYTGIITKTNSTNHYSSVLSLEKGKMFFNNIDTFKKLFKGFK